MTTQQPEALRLADKMSNTGWSIGCAWDCHQASVELRRLYESNTELVKALEEMLDGEGKSFRELCEQARAAINKAEGGTT